MYYTTGPWTSGNGTATLTATSVLTGESNSTSVTVVPLSSAVSVTPDGGTPSPEPGVGASTSAAFTVTDVGNSSPTNYSLGCTYSGVVTSCGVASSVSVSVGSPQTVTVSYTTSSSTSGGTGTLTLTASETSTHTYTDQGSYNVTVADARTYTPVVTPKSDSVTYNEANVSTNYVFAVKNTGDTQAIYTLSAPTCAGTASGCTIPTNPITVNSGQTVTAPVYFTTGASGQIVTIDLHATMSAHGATFADDGSVEVVPTAPTVVVTPVTGSMNAGTNSSGTYAFNVHNEGTSGQITYTLQVTGCTAPVTSCAVPGFVTVAQGADSIVNVSFQTQATSGAGQIGLLASKKFVNTYSSTGTGTVNVSSSLAVSTAFMNNDDQDMSLCAASCFAMTAARSTVPYYTLDTPRSVTLLYNGDRAFPRPFIYADVSVTSPPASLQSYHLEVWRNGARLHFTNGDSILVFQAPTTPSSTYRLAGQIDMSSYTTGVYPVQVIVTALYSNGGSDVSTTNTQLLIVNTQSSGVAKGWTVAGVPRLYLQSDSSAVITDGAGSALYFTKGGAGYTAPNGDYTTLATSSNGGWVRTSLDNTKVWFGSTGLADSVTDRLDYSTQFVYDGSQRLIKIYDPFLIRSVGATRAATVLSYGTNGLQSIREANPVASSGRIDSVRVDGSGLLRSVVDPTGTDSTTYGYDTSLRLNAITNSSGHTTTYTYGTSWKLAQVTAPSVPIDAGGGSTTMQQPTTSMQPWQSVGVPTTATGGSSPAAPVRPDTIVARVTDANGYVSTMRVNRWGQPDSTTDPAGNVTQYQRSGIFALTQSIPDGTATAGVNYYAYSGAYLTMSFPAGSDSVNYDYGAAAQVDSTWGPGTVFQRNFLKTDGRADSVEYDHNTNRIARYTYDPTTKAVASVTDPAGHTTSYSYDPTFGNLTQTISPGGRYQTLHFDAYGRDSVVIAPGIAAHYTRYDLLNRPVVDSVPGNGGATRMRYPHDTTVVTDAKGQVYRSDMNALGWATTQHHPDGTLAPITNRYDKGGRLTSTSNRRGQMITLTYDALGRVLTRSDPVSGTTSFSYSPGGFRTVASNATVKDSTMSLLYCQTGQYSISYACNSDTTVVTMASNPTKHFTMGMTAPGAFDQAASSGDDDGYTQFESKFSRNSLGLADSVTLGPLTMKYAYDPYDGLLTTTSLPNTSTRTDQYTTNNEEYNWTYTDTTMNPLYRRSYRVDLLGRVTSEQMGYPYTSLASSYQLNREAAYDSLGHVSEVNWSYQSCIAWPGSNPDSLSADQGWRDLCSPSAIFSESYSYDAVGNRTDADAAYDPGNRLTSVDWATYVYDADGNVTSRTDANTGQLMKFFWDAGSQLDSVQISGGGSPSASVEYRYDPYGRLIMRTATDSTPSTGRLYVYGAGSNSSNIMKEVDLVTGNTTEYEYASVDHPTMSVTRDSAGTVLASRTYMMDGLGNVVGSALDGSTGAAILYDSWGNIQTDSTAYARLNTLRFGFKGMLYDETTGLYNARARWYQPDVGRFMSEDPIGLAGGVNQYVFAADDPLDLSDPTGLYSCANVSINATDCEDPLQFPGSGSYGPGAYGGGVSFAGGFGSITPGVAVGSAVIRLSGQPALCWDGECARHTVIATLTDAGSLDIYQLYNSIVGSAAILRSSINDDDHVNDPSDGFWISFTDWRWVQVAGTGAIPDVVTAISVVAPRWEGQPYQLGDSNIFVNEVLSAAGITLTTQQQQQLGWRPTFMSLPRNP